MKISILILMLFFCLSHSPVPQGEKQKIKFTVHHIRSNEGMIRIGVYDRADKFNKEELHSFSFSKAAMRNGELLCKFELEKGEYAFSLLDDENSDNEMNYNLIGIPNEGFGFSRDAKINFMTPPSYEDCALQVKTGSNNWRIKMRYF